jgi:hypothetical protein
MYWFATDMGAAGENPGIVTEMMSGLGREPDGPERFLRVLNHELAPSQVFTPRRALRSVIRGSVKRPRALLQLVGETGTLVSDEMRRRRLRQRPQSGAVDDPTIATTGSTASGRQVGSLP